MSAISATAVRELREKTGAGMMECKKALVETDGDFDKAILYLKEKGLADASKRSHKATAEGCISVLIDEKANKAVIIELNCETDFVAKNEQFQAYANDIAKGIMEGDGSSIPVKVEDLTKEAIAKLGENVNISNYKVVKGIANETFNSYIHQGGMVGVLLRAELSDPKAKTSTDLDNGLKDVCMHIAAMSPMGINDSDIDSKILDEQRQVFTKQAKESGKPDNVVENIVNGKVKKYLKEIVLYSQEFVKNNEQSIEQFLKEIGKKAGADIKVKEFIRYKVGENRA